MTMLTTGVIGSSRKENESRVPIHPSHLLGIDERLRQSLRFQRGYGERFGMSDDELEGLCGGLADRDALLAESELVILPKPMPNDLRELRDGSVLWGWPHCVQQKEMTQIAIERHLTLIAWEAMFQWSGNGQRGTHIFALNNELAGYCGILHALELLGLDGAYGPSRSVVILGFGSVSRGAVYALLGRGFADITIYTQRPPHHMKDRLFGARHLQMRPAEHPGAAMQAVAADGSVSPLMDALAEADIIVNGTLQNTDAPLNYLLEGQEKSLRPGTLIVDISCDLGMGFLFARPTSFEEPIVDIGAVRYYAVDHTPSYLWDAASWENSEALLHYLSVVMEGPEAWKDDLTISRCIEIRDGTIQNPMILSYQKREKVYPHHARD